MDTWLSRKFAKKEFKLGRWIKRKYEKKRAKFGRKYLFPLVTSRDAGAEPGRLAAALFSWFYPEYRILPLVRVSAVSTEIAMLWPPMESLTAAPKVFGEPAQTFTSTFPGVRARRLSDAGIMAKASAVRLGNAIGLPDFYIDRPNALLHDGEFLLSQVGGKGVLRSDEPETIEKGVGVFGSSALNWFHWLIEILPSATFAQALDARYSDHPLLVPEECLAMPTFRDALEAAAPGRALIPLSSGKTFSVKELVAIDMVVHGPMNMRPGLWPGLSDYAQHADALRHHRRTILDSTGTRPGPPRRNIFLARGNNRRHYNQDEVLAIATGLGFETVFPEKLGFAEQVQLYHDASIILGASGAAFANTLFCQSGSKALTWILPQYKQFCVYTNLAGVVGLDLNYLFVTPDKPIGSSSDAYSASYTIDPDAFRETVTAMLAS